MILRHRRPCLIYTRHLSFINSFVLETNKTIASNSLKDTVQQDTEAVARRCSVKKVILEISQYSQKNTCARVSFIFSSGLRPASLFKKRLWHRYFPVSFVKFLRTLFITEHHQWLLLKTYHRKGLTAETYF